MILLDLTKRCSNPACQWCAVERAKEAVAVRDDIDTFRVFSHCQRGEHAACIKRYSFHERRELIFVVCFCPCHRKDEAA